MVEGGGHRVGASSEAEAQFPLKATSPHGPHCLCGKAEGVRGAEG